MRYIPRNCIKENAVLALPIYGAKGEILLREGINLSKAYLDKMDSYGFPGAYINDPVSADVDITESISTEVKNTALIQMASSFKDAAITSGNSKNADLAGAALKKSAENIVDDILSNSDVLFNLFDIKTFDNYMFMHSLNVAALSIAIGTTMDLSKQDLIQLAFSALLHDIGNVFIDEAILNKKGKLTTEEMQKIGTHPKEGFDYVRRNYYSTISMVTARGILDHHERVDGSGYPNRLKGENISLYGRIIAVADVYDALISDRPYRKALPHAEAIEYIQGNCSSLFDYDVVCAFTKKVAPYSVGSTVKLSDDSIALIMENYEGFPNRPKIKIFMKDGKNIEPKIISLKDEAFNLTIITSVEM